MNSEQAEKLILEKISKWHNSDSLMHLHEYLGWSYAEYVLYIEKNIIPARYEIKDQNDGKADS